MNNFKKTELRIGKNKLFVEMYSPSNETKISNDNQTGKVPLIFIGGVFDGSWIFSNHASYIASVGRRTVYAINLRGQYLSKCANVSRLMPDDHLEDINEVISGLKLPQYILAGYSMGGALALKHAEITTPKALVLYDPTYPRSVAKAIGEKPPAKPPRLAPAMHFVPSKNIVEEMYDEPLLHGKYLKIIELFRQTYASAKVYYQTEIERLDINLSKIKCPTLLLAVNSHNNLKTFQEFAKQLPQATLAIFDGYSHGSFLASRYYEPVAREVAKWLDNIENNNDKKPQIITYNWFRDINFNGGKHKMHLHYFTSWENPTIEIFSSAGTYLTSVPMKKISSSPRTPSENIFEAELNFKKTNSFHIINKPLGEDSTTLAKPDIPAPGRRYAPLLGGNLWLMDGKFYSYDPLSEQGKILPKYTTHFYESSQMKQKFAVHIRTPRGYDPQKKYPVAILNDGQNQYKGWGMHGGWHTDASLQWLNECGRAPEVILVAIESPQRRRNETYLPPPIGRADLYVNFLADELLPSLRKNFSITESPSEIAIIGASYGANNSVYAGLYRPDTFGLIGSLSFAYLPKCPIRSDMRSRDKLPFVRLYADCGTKWAADQPNRDDSTNCTKDLDNIAKSKGMIEGKNLLGLVFAGHYHNEIYWRKRIALCLEFLFSPDNI